MRGALMTKIRVFNTKDVYGSIHGGTNTQGLNRVDMYKMANTDAIAELEKMKQIIIEKNIGIGDCQLMYDKNFMPVIADPNKLSIGKDADKELVKATVDKIKNEIEMIDYFIKNKKSYLEKVEAKSKL